MSGIAPYYKKPKPLYEDDTGTIKNCLKCLLPFRSKMGARICPSCNRSNSRIGKTNGKEVTGISAVRRGREPR